jgi:ribonuclease HI
MKQIEIYTDGACKGNGRAKAHGGYGIHFPNGEHKDISRPMKQEKGKVTNQRAELKAILIGIKKCKKLEPEKIKIYSDSEYSIKCATVWYKNWQKNGWKNAKMNDVENQDLIKRIRKHIENYDGKVEFHHVRGHSGCKGNDIADKLATDATNSQIDKLKIIKII